MQTYESEQDYYSKISKFSSNFNDPKNYSPWNYTAIYS